MYTRRLCHSALLFTGMLPARDQIASIQVTGAIKQPLTFSADNLAKMPRASLRTSSNGMETHYEGVWLHGVLKRAGVPRGEALRGKALASYVLAEAQDGYQAISSLGELDPAFIDNEILPADTTNGKPLFGALGRFRLVLPKDNHGAHLARMLTKIEVVQIRK